MLSSPNLGVSVYSAANLQQHVAAAVPGQPKSCGLITRHYHAFSIRYSDLQIEIIYCLECDSMRPFLTPVLLKNCRSPSLWCRPTIPAQPLRSADAESFASTGSGWMDMPESQPPAEIPIEVFPRLKERDPYKRLGVTHEASFEEVQDARNFLYDQYRQHEPSKESIELAFDDILQEKMKVRHRFGFRPPQRGKRGEVQGDAPRLSLWQQIRGKFESSVPGTTLVNDGSIFVALGIWAAWQAASSDPTLPIGAAICFCAWKLYDKRSKRDPDGPHIGGSPIWGALGSTLLALIVGGVVSYALVHVLPVPPRLSGEAVGLFLISICLGAACIFLK